MTELLTSRKIAVRAAWRHRFARWRETGRPEVAIQLIMESIGDKSSDNKLGLSCVMDKIIIK